MDFMDRNVNGSIDRLGDLNRDGKISPNEQVYINDQFYNDNGNTGYSHRGSRFHIPDYEAPYAVLYAVIFILIVLGQILG